RQLWLDLFEVFQRRVGGAEILLLYRFHRLIVILLGLFLHLGRNALVRLSFGVRFDLGGLVRSLVLHLGGFIRGFVLQFPCFFADLLAGFAHFVANRAQRALGLIDDRWLRVRRCDL